MSTIIRIFFKGLIYKPHVVIVGLATGNEIFDASTNNEASDFFCGCNKLILLHFRLSACNAI